MVFQHIYTMSPKLCAQFRFAGLFVAIKSVLADFKECQYLLICFVGNDVIIWLSQCLWRTWLEYISIKSQQNTIEWKPCAFFVGTVMSITILIPFVEYIQIHIPTVFVVFCIRNDRLTNILLGYHYSDVMWTRWRLKSPASRLFVQPFVQAQIKENIKAPRHWLCEENPPVTIGFPSQRDSNAENISIWWRHHIYWRGANIWLSKCHSSNAGKRIPGN